MSLLSKLAAKYNGYGVDAINKSDLKKLIRLLKDGCTEEDAIQMVKNTAIAQKESGERLLLLNKIAAEYNRYGVDAINKSDLKKLIKLLKDGCTEEDAIQMIKNTAIAQEESGERSRIKSKLAKVYNSKDSVGDGIAAIQNDSCFEAFTQLYGTSELAVAAVIKLANQTNATFWRNYKELETYIGKDNKRKVEIGGDMVVVVDPQINDKLYSWLKTMTNFKGIEGKTTVPHVYGVIAHICGPGSVEYESLAKLGIIFADCDENASKLRDAYAEVNAKKVRDERNNQRKSVGSFLWGGPGDGGGGGDTGGDLGDGGGGGNTGRGVVQSFFSNIGR